MQTGRRGRGGCHFNVNVGLLIYLIEHQFINYLEKLPDFQFLVRFINITVLLEICSKKDILCR